MVDDDGQMDYAKSDKMLLKEKGRRLFYFQIIFSPLGHQMLYENNILLFVFHNLNQLFNCRELLDGYCYFAVISLTINFCLNFDCNSTVYCSFSTGRCYSHCM